jgi:hypothetical protein
MWRSILVGVMIALTPIDTAKAVGSYESGDTLLAACSVGDAAFCYGYLEGVADAMDAGNPINGSRACIPKPVTVAQLHDVVIQYL